MRYLLPLFLLALPAFAQEACLPAPGVTYLQQRIVDLDMTVAKLVAVNAELKAALAVKEKKDDR